MGPLSKIWTTVESARLSQEDSVKVDLNEIQEFVEQTILLLGQVSNSISYYRRFYMLLALTNSPQPSKQMLREDSELLQKNDKKNLWKKFRENIWHTCRSKKANYRDVIQYIANKIQTLSSWPTPDTEKEFRRATTTKASSPERNDVTVFEKAMQ